MKQYFGEEVPSAVCCAPVENRGMIFTDDKGGEYAFRQEGRNVWRGAFDGWLVAKAAESGAEYWVLAVDESAGRCVIKL